MIKKLRYLRIISGLSQDKIANILDISQSKVSRAELGHIKFNAEEKRKIGEIFNVSPEEIFPLEK